MSRVSVAESSKPKAAESFRFLRRDEGRMSYAAGTTSPAAANTPTAGNGTNPHQNNDSRNGSINREARDSKSLREAIAFDMRNAKSHDPLGEVVVAVPRKAPPSHRASSTPPPTAGSHQPPSGTRSSFGAATRAESVGQPPSTQRLQTPLAAARKRPGWVNSDISPARGASETSLNEPLVSASASRLEEEQSRYRGLTPRQTSTTTTAAAPVPSYPVLDAEEESSVAAHSTEAGGNYFRRPLSTTTAPSIRARETAEAVLMMHLEQEIGAAQEERERYATAQRQLEEERTRFDAYRARTEQQLAAELEKAESSRAKNQRDAQKDLRVAEERHRTVSGLLMTEREANRRLTHENDTLRSQLEELTATLRDTQQTHKAELTRARRDIDSLTKRNAELLAMAKEQQVTALEERSRQRSRESVQPTAAPVLDFTPRVRDAAEEAAQERRSKETAERLEMEAEAQAERRRRRESEMEERRKAASEKEKEKAAAETRTRAVEKAKAAAAEAKTSSVARSRATEEERRVSGHPATTPRVTAGSSTNASVHQRVAPATSSTTAAATAPALSKVPSRQRIPTRDELLGDGEQPPAEDTGKDAVVSHTAIGDNPNKTETLYRSGRRELHYANGTMKTVLPSGHTLLNFTNGDIKCTFPSGKSTYWYDAAGTMHTQLPDGAQTFEFRTTGQTERHRPDGSKAILYPDGIYKVVDKEGVEQTFYPDGELMDE